MSDEMDDVDGIDIPSDVAEMIIRAVRNKEANDDNHFHTGRVVDNALARAVLSYGIASPSRAEVRVRTLCALSDDPQHDAISNHAAFEASVWRDGKEISSYQHMRIDGALAGLARAALLSFFEGEHVTPEGYNAKCEEVAKVITTRETKIGDASNKFKRMKLSDKDKDDLGLN